MRCDEMREVLGSYADGEIAPEMRAAVDAHVCACEACRSELGQLRELAERIQAGGSVAVPPALWDRIADKLDSARPPRSTRRIFRLRSILAFAACLLLAVGGGYLVLTRGVDFASKAEAATVDFSVLLNGLSLDAEGAFRQFVALYHGRRVSAAEAQQHARQLNFAIPQELPGGFGLQEAFALQIGDTPAAAAIYRRDNEFIGTIFHRAIHREDYGTYRDHPCVVGEHRGHRVEAGEWHLIHVTDATTCHCVLSRLNEKSELPPILNAVAPHSDGSASDHDHNDRP